MEQNPSRQPALQIKGLLQDIHNACIPPIADPPCRKRASVALIIRIRPTYPDEAVFEPAKLSQPKCFQDQLDSFFDQPWVKRGDPEVLFIKRASRQGDRWTGHIALPGGKRDLEDLSDKATSLRETREEIGLALNADHCLIVGNLPERVVTTAWGKIPFVDIQSTISFPC